jgi:integrase
MGTILPEGPQMKSMKALTDRSVAAATSDQPDGKVPGLALRVGASSKSWSLAYRVRGSRTKRRIKLGSYPAISLARARQAALEALAAAQEGGDPRYARKQHDEAREQTLSGCVSKYIDNYAMARHKRWQATRNQFDAYVVPHWGKIPVGSIDAKHVIELLDKLADRPATRRAVYLALSAFFEWCLGKHLVKVNPVRAIAKTERPRPVDSRDRVLTNVEIKALWKGCETLDDRYANFGIGVKLLLLTGQRRDQVFGLRWAEIDLERAEWVTPSGRMKSGREHFSPLSPLAVDLLAGLERHGEFIFSTDGTVPFSGFSKAKSTLDKECKVNAWRLHDLRRTAAVLLQRGGAAPFLVEAIQGRISGTFGGAAGVYQRYGYADEKRVALSKLADEVNRLVHGTKAKVINFRTRSGKS